MTQSTANEQLSAYLDGELTDVERSELEKALAEDPALRQELVRLEKAVAFLRLHGPAQAPAGFQERLLKKVESEPMPGGWWRWLRRPFGIPVEGFAVALAAAMVLLVALPFGLKTATQAGKDLAADPYGSLTEETRSAASRSAKGLEQGTVSDKEDAAPQEDEPAVASLEPDEVASGEPIDAVLGTRGPTPEVKSAETAARPVAATPGYGSGGGAADREGVAVSTTSAPPPPPAPSGYSNAQAPAVPGTLLAYQILTYDEDALSKLQRIAARYRGRVIDSSGATAKSLTLEPGHTYLVEVPASALAAFGDDLRSLGMVTENTDPRKWAGDTVRVQVTFQLVPSEPARSAPTTSSESQ